MSWDDFQPWWTGLAPVVTLVIGYLGTIATESRRDRRAAAVKAAEDRASRQQAADDRRREFELEKPLEADNAHRAMARAFYDYLGDPQNDSGTVQNCALAYRLLSASCWMTRSELR
jgi:hypothetical protein